MALGLHIGLWTSALNSGNLGPRILTSNAAPVTELSEDGDYVIQLYTSDDSSPTYSIVGGNGAFAIGDVPAGDGYAGPGTMKGVVIADATLIDFSVASMPVVVSATGLANITITVITGGEPPFWLGDADNFLAADADNYLEAA
ncbi:MAG: hypothetical protein ACRBC3_19650 [Burkholderiaceae bacterium]